MASLDARKTPLPTLWKPTPIFLCPFVANNEVLRILIKISFPRRHPYFSLFLFIQVSYKIILVLLAFCEPITKKGPRARTRPQGDHKGFYLSPRQPQGEDKPSPLLWTDWPDHRKHSRDDPHKLKRWDGDGSAPEAGRGQAVA